MVEIDTITDKLVFLGAFKPDGYQKVEVVQQETRLNQTSCRYMVEWAAINQLLISGEKGYYKLSDKGVEWIHIANELKISGALMQIEVLLKMSAKMRPGKQYKKKNVKPKDKSCPPGGCIVLPSKHS